MLRPGLVVAVGEEEEEEGAAAVVTIPELLRFALRARGC
jgi:hypothetical protein